jgi:hypothetical protein
MSDVVHYRFGGSQRRRYEKLDRVPEGLIVLGDAVCSFNPVYGQGMTVSAIEAECLDRALGSGKQPGGIKPDFGRRWFRSISSVIDIAWDSVSIEDFRFPELIAQCPLRSKADPMVHGAHSSGDLPQSAGDGAILQSGQFSGFSGDALPPARRRRRPLWGNKNRAPATPLMHWQSAGIDLAIYAASSSDPTAC